MAMKPEQAFAQAVAVSEAYTKASLEGAGAIKGDKGDPGPQGPKGDKGDKGDGSTVAVTPILSDGTKIAEIDVDGNEVSLYAPTGSANEDVDKLLTAVSDYSFGAENTKIMMDVDAYYDADTNSLYYCRCNPLNNNRVVLAKIDVSDIEHPIEVGFQDLGMDDVGLYSGGPWARGIASYGNYLYVGFRSNVGGCPPAADFDKTWGGLVCVDKTDLSVVWMEPLTGKVSGVSIFTAANGTVYLAVSCALQYINFYTIDPNDPTSITLRDTEYTVYYKDVEGIEHLDMQEVQQSAFCETPSHRVICVVAGFGDGIHFFDVTGLANGEKAVFYNWKSYVKPNSDLWKINNTYAFHSMSVAVKYPYAYCTMAPSSVFMQDHYDERRIGVLVIDFRDLENLSAARSFIEAKDNCEFYGSDPRPVLIRLWEDKLFMPTGNSGIAVFDISHPFDPYYMGMRKVDKTYELGGAQIINDKYLLVGDCAVSVLLSSSSEAYKNKKYLTIFELSEAFRDLRGIIDEKLSETSRNAVENLVLTKELATKLERVSSMPLSVKANEGRVVLLTSPNGAYKQGTIYQCNKHDDNRYYWDKISIGKYVSGDGIEIYEDTLKNAAIRVIDRVITVSFLPIANESRLGNCYLLTENQTGYQVGSVYECIANGTSPETYSYKLLIGDYVSESEAEDIAYNTSKAIDGVMEKGAFVPVSLGETEAKYIHKTSGSLVPFSLAETATINVVPGEKYRIQANCQYESAIYAFYDAKGVCKFIYPNSGSESFFTTVDVTIPEDIAMLRAGTLVPDSYPLKVWKFDANGSLAVDFLSIEGIESYVDHDFVDQSITLENKYLYRDSGNWVAHDSCQGGTIAVTEREVYKITAKDGTTNLAIYYFFDGNGRPISHYPSDSSSSTELQTVTVTVPANAVELRVSSWGHDNLQLKKWIALDTKYKIPTKSNILYGKKWAACGDSFTAGDFTNYVDKDGNSGRNSDAFDEESGHYKTYPWWIGNRNDMEIQWLAMGGNDFTNIEGATRPFSDPATTYYNYTQIANDCDYITLMFGLNENGLTTEQIGTKTDSDNTTLWGAYNVVLEAILTANPTVKIGIIISDDGLAAAYHDALIEIAKYWGIPYLDLRNGTQIPMMIGGRLDEVSQVAKTLRNNAFKCSAEDVHPNVVAHEYRSTVIENFLRSL